MRQHAKLSFKLSSSLYQSCFFSGDGDYLMIVIVNLKAVREQLNSPSGIMRYNKNANEEQGDHTLRTH